MSDLLQGLVTNAPAILKTLLLYEFQVTIFVLVVWGIDRWLRRAPSGFRYALWLVVLVKALWPPSFTIPGFAVLPTVPIELPALAVTATGGGVPVQQSSLPLITILLLLWGLMSAGLLLLMLISFVSFRLRLRAPHARPWQPGEEISSNGRTWPPVWYTDRIPSPLTLGLIKPRIYLTPAAAESDSATLAAILHHELAHVRRRDGWVTLLQGAALVIHPFNPLVWLMNRRLTSYREQVCDDFALRHTAIAPREYGRALIDQLGRSVPAPLMLHPKTLFFETKRDLKQRLQQLLTRKEGTMNNHTTIRQKLLLASLMAGLLFISSQCQEESIELSESQPTAPTGEITGPPGVKYVPYDEPPRPIGGYAAILPNVVYPEKARAAGIEGMVAVQAFITEDGKASEITVFKNDTSETTVFKNDTGDPSLWEAAMAAIQNTAFEPAKQEGKPVGVWIIIPVNFKLKE